jgi:hypothetical protein
LPDIAGKAADKGNIVHKALELLAHKKLALQEGRDSFTDEEVGTFKVDDLDPDNSIEIAYHSYAGKESPHIWEQSDFDICRKWLWDALLWRDGMFSPLKREIVAPEQKFEFIIDEPWAAYDYALPNGKRLAGQLGIKGTLDLLVRQGTKDLELIDWKTGAKKNWATFKNKDYDSLIEDPQLRLYHYAAKRLYPQYENVFVTIFYIQDGGPDSLCFTDKDLVATEEMLKKRFNTIRNNVKPRRVYPSRKCNWCHYAKVDVNNTPVEDYKVSVCNQIYQETQSLGLDRVVKKYGNLDKINHYGEGGGKRNVN